ncbi:hypothetical protein PoB_002678200 [Plakobranchus ocellatus]|uniref:EGF-like domain-containing protein n=1 Tax=Plakobranchus ocellatus TaxID=259542 RepID=A0AAV3ZZ10_9GAST|nr:hypothetical protein PoB_002678200 [Plakobranchus ocellatus]
MPSTIDLTIRAIINTVHHILDYSQSVALFHFGMRPRHFSTRATSLFVWCFLHQWGKLLSRRTELSASSKSIPDESARHLGFSLFSSAEEQYLFRCGFLSSALPRVSTGSSVRRQEAVENDDHSLHLKKLKTVSEMNGQDKQRSTSKKQILTNRIFISKILDGNHFVRLHRNPLSPVLPSLSSPRAFLARAIKEHSYLSKLPRGLHSKQDLQALRGFSIQEINSPISFVKEFQRFVSIPNRRYQYLLTRTLNSRQSHFQMPYLVSKDGERQGGLRFLWPQKMVRPNDNTKALTSGSRFKRQVPLEFGTKDAKFLGQPLNKVFIRVITSGPTKLTDTCHTDRQCRRLDPNSICKSKECVCPSNMFVSQNRTTCVDLPSKIGDSCSQHKQCEDGIGNSSCRNYNNGSFCSCVSDHFASSDRKKCQPEPKILGDFCEKGIKCSDFLPYTVCNDSSCVCQYGYTNASMVTCIERPRLPKYVPVPPESTPLCQDGVCTAWTNNTSCLDQGINGTQLCVCKKKTARRYNETDCVAVQTYELRLRLRERASTYDYAPLHYKWRERSTMTNRIVLSGVKVLFENSSLSDRYVSSEMSNMWDLSNARPDEHGIHAVILVHFTADYLKAEKTEIIFKAVEAQLLSSSGEVGNSRLKVLPPYSDSVSVLDYNECEAKATDCSIHANCMNTLGSYLCVCKPGFVDKEKTHEKYMLRGKICQRPVAQEDACLNECDTSIEIIIGVLVLFLLIIMAFIGYEIVQRKKTFNARALYARFGTTKIRKLQKASMRRIKERKKKMEEESKKKREEHKKNKEKMKKAGAAEKAQKNKEKKCKAEEKKQKRQESAELRKVEKERKKEAKRKKNKGGMMEEQESSALDCGARIEESCVDMPPMSDDERRTRGTSGATPAPSGRCDNTYPVASPGIDQYWNIGDSDEFPV